MNVQLDIQGRRGDFQLDVQIRGGDKPIFLTGPNGSGKTTLLRAIAGAVVPDRGSIQIKDRLFFCSRTAICLPPEHRRVAYVPQGLGLFPHLTITDNIAFSLRFQTRLKSAERKKKVADFLLTMGWESLARQPVHQLSGGMAQRVALARALIMQPDILLLDEPFASLDRQGRQSVSSFLLKTSESWGVPVILATHYLEDVSGWNGQVCRLEQGYGRLFADKNFDDQTAAS